MAEELIHGFIGGLNKDLATSLVQADSYIDANNIRIVTQEGQSSGILMNILGNQLSFSIPDVSETVINSVTIPASTNLQIIGWATIRDTIVLFTCPAVVNGTGQIWAVEYDSVTQTTTGPVLKYNQLLNFDSKHPIQAIGRYETTTIQRVYWTDNYNPPRNINLANPDVLNTDIDIVNLTSSTTLNIPLVSEIVTGGSLLAGSYQYTYRLKKKNGTYSVVAPLSNLVNIVASDENTTEFQNYEGSEKGTVTGKAVVYNITNKDDTYDYIEHIFLFKDTYDTVPLIYIYKIEPATLSTITVKHSRNTDTTYVPITLEELLISTQNEFQKVKTITTKDNMLFFGNTKSQSFKVDYDSRAYRFNSFQKAKLVSKTDIYWDYVLDSTADFALVPKDHDAINPHNDFNDPTPSSNLYKYQLDGTTLGGQGPNIKYEFTYVDGIVDNDTYNLKTASPFYTSDRTTATYYLDIPQQYYPQNNFYNNIKSPYYSSIYTGYARGEVYRFGIVFYDKSGRQSYANWIGDIRIPDHDEPNFYMGNVGGSPYSKTTARQIGLKFIVSIPPEIKSICSGYSIVRVERDDNNKSKLATGILGEVITNQYRDRNYCNKTIATDTRTEEPFIKTLDGPAFHFNNISYREGDYLKVIGVTNYTAGALWKDYGNEQSYTKSYTAGTTNNPFPSTYKFYIQKYNFVYPAATVSADPSNGLPKDFINMGDPLSGDFQAAGGRTSLIVIDRPLTITGNGDYQQMIFVSYQRDLIDQYGGDTFSARGNNTYINCSNFFPVASFSINGFDVFNVFGGDTYVNYYDHTKYDKNYPGETPYGWDPDDIVLRSRFARVHLAESPLNTDLRHGNHFNKNQDNVPTWLWGEFKYNQVYSQQNNTRVYIPEPVIDTTQEEFDSRIWYSKPKINGEQTDNWTFIDGYKDIESIYGPINRLEVLNDNLFAFQDKAVANILVNPLSVIQDNNASNLVLGKATGVIQKHIYLSTEIGCKHQWSVVKSDKTIYWFDILGKRLCNIESTTKGAVVLEISDVKGLFSYFQENLKGDINNIVHNSAYLIGDSPTYQYGITAGYDYRNKEVIFTFLDTNKKFTLAFNEILAKFTSFYSFKPNLYIYTKDKFISADPESLNQVYLHNIDNTYSTFYSTPYDSDFSIITNKFPANTKVYDNLELFSEVTIDNVDTGSSFNKVQCTTKYQDSGLITLTPNVSIKRRERSWKLFVPRDTNITGSTFQARLRDKYLITKLVFTNVDNKKLLLHWLKVLFRASIS